MPIGAKSARGGAPIRPAGARAWGGSGLRAARRRRGGGRGRRRRRAATVPLAAPFSARAIQAIRDERMASSTDIWIGCTHSVGTNTV
ncbi:hypothetical protein NB2BOR_A13450 [Bordetella parapertussis]|nr:hypothetical protein NB2BOR_A13450 [Bordetella parapertussis]